MATIMKLPLRCICFQIMLWHLLLSGVTGHIVPILVINKCRCPIWPGTAPNTGHPVIADGGFYLGPNRWAKIQAPWDWSGRIWARTGCNFEQTRSNNTWQPACETGDCDGRLACNGLIGSPPATLVELTLLTDKAQPSYYDVSVVDGYNLPVSVEARPNDESSSKCTIGGCLRDLKKTCPLELQVKDKQGKVVACKSACLGFNLDRFCCRNEYGNPKKCTPSLYSQVFKAACPSYFSYAYDSPPPLVSCMVKELVVTFCPANWGDDSTEDASI